MSESSTDTPLPSQENASKVAECNAVTSNLLNTLCENEKSEIVKLQPSKITNPGVLKIPSSNTSAQVTRIGRLCNNISKPAVPSNSATSLAPVITIAKNGWLYESFREAFANRVSLRDIGIRQHVVHFDFGHRRGKNETGVGGGGGGGERIMSTSIRRISDELARKRLTDVDETDENTIPSYGNGKWAYDRKMSSGSVLSDSSRKSDELFKKRSSDASTSADSYVDYWKSDFEPRRASDASVVLTEDTDQFIIGDRVWVGGVKPGQIAYIGETQFAPGEWAGVVLDEPIGKNDGTVANIRYFQCEPKKGIFSRLTRLTRYPLVEGGAGEPAAPRATPSESRRSNGSLLASVPKKSSLVLTPSAGPKTSISKPPSPDSSIHPNVQVGDRVIVKSSQGSKAGILRYTGTTDFAPGEWCGVELDDPLGKNDGSVSGTRYFECRPKFGLFAPLHKVSKSPANKRPSQGNCVIHNRGGSTTTGIRRQGSKESLVSLSSTASTAASVRSTNRKIGVRTPTTPTSAKNALQETLKEKELHIEQLLKERDLERAEVTRAASQADEAERRLVALKQEFEQQKEEAEARLSDLDAMVCLLKSENEELKSLIDDERKKFEDLQFRFEEETIDKADLKSMSLKYEEKLKMLEKILFEERKKMEALEQDSNKLFEAEEQLVIMKDELDSTKDEISQLKKMRSTLEQEHISLEAHLTSARAEIESLKIENESLKSSATQNQSSLQENLSEVIQAFEKSKKELEKKEGETDHLVKEMAAKDNSFLEKEKELHGKYLKIINDLTEKHKSESENLSRQLQELKNQSDSRLKVLENQLEEKIKLCNCLETQVNDLNILLSKNSAEKLVEQNKQKEEEEKFQKELKKAAEEIMKSKEEVVEETTKNVKLLREKQKLGEELEETHKLLKRASESAEKQLTELKETIEKQREELNEMKATVESKSEECEALQKLLKTNKMEEGRRFQDMESAINRKNSEVEELKTNMGKQKEEFESKNREVMELCEAREESFKVKIKSLEEAEAEKRKEVETLTGNLEKVNSLLLMKESQLTSEQEKSQKLEKKLGALEENCKKISEEKNQMQLDAGDAARRLQCLEDKLMQVTSQKTKLESDLSNFINSSNDSSLQMVKLNEELRSKEKEFDALREDVSLKMQNHKRVEQELKQIIEEKQAEVNTFKEELENAKRDHTQETENLKKKLEVCSANFSAADVEWRRKMESLKTESDSRVKFLEEHIRLMEKKGVEDKSKHEEDVKKLINAQEELRGKLAEAEIAAITCKNSLEMKVNELSVERNNLMEFVEKTKIECLNSEKQSAEKLKRNAEALASESEKLRKELKETTGKLAETVEELSKVKDDKNKLNEEKSKLEKIKSTMEERLNELKDKNWKLETSATSFESENQLLKGMLNQLREEKCLLDKDLTEKMMQVTELRSQLEAVEFSRKTREAENEVKIRNLEAEISELRSKLQKTDNSHATEISERCRLMADLKNEIDRLKQESSQMMSEKIEELENANVIVSQLRKELGESKFYTEKERERMGMMEKQFLQAKEELESEKKKCEEYGKRLNASETEKIDLKERLEEKSKLLVDGAAIEAELTETKRKLNATEKREEETMNNAKLERETLEKMLETTNSLLTQKESETKTLTEEIGILKQEKINLINQNRRSVETLEKEKAELQAKLQETMKIEKKEPNSTSKEGGQRDLQDEREFQKGQVDFLNSVIVDMQKKNDALKARIEILEMGFSAEDVDEFNLHNITPRSVAPRLFCDICDRFDLHDTEDCPTQANEDAPPPKSSKAKLPQPERPYCEICEVFGHDTTDCDDGETF